MEKGARAWERKMPWNGLIDECYRYAAPGMNPYVDGAMMHGDGGTAGVPRHDHLFDNTLAEAAEDAAGRMATETFTPGKDWAEVTEGPMWAPGVEMGETDRQETAGREKKTELLQMLKTKLFGAVHASNFYLGAQSSVFDGIISGTGVMKITEGRDSSTLVDCESVNQSTVAFERGPAGTIWGFYRNLQLTAREIAALWPKADKINEPGSDMETKARSPRKYKVGDCEYYDPFTGLWYYDLLVDADGLRRIFTEDSLLSRWMAWRYRLLAGEVQGRSPVMTALPGGRTINHAKRVQLQSASIRAVGAYTYESDGIINPRNIRMTPGAFIKVKSNLQGRPTIRALELSGDVQMNQIIMEQEALMIRKTMGTEGLPSMAGPVRSPTEILERVKDNLMRRGVPYLRLHEEMGRPALRRFAHVLAKNGHLPEVEAVIPTKVEKGKDGKERKEIQPLLMNGTDIGLKFHSPVVEAQRLSDAETIHRWAMMSQQAALEDFRIGARTEDLPQALGEKMAVPRGLYRDKEERAEMMQAVQGMAEGGQEQMEETFA